MSRDRSRGAQPQAGRRLQAVDAARGVALLGMMAVHVLPPTAAAGDVSWAHELARGRASAAFAVLAGVAIALSTGGTTPPTGRRWQGAAAGLLVRCVLIGLLGLALGEADSGLAIILVYYALLFGLAAPLLGLPWRSLAGLAVGAALLVPTWSHVVRADLPPLRGPSPRFADLAELPTLLTELAVTGYYPALAWTTYLAAGLAVGRLDLRSTAVARRLLLVGIALAVSAHLLSAALVDHAVGTDGLRPTAADEIQHGTTPTSSGWWLTLAEPHSGTPLDLAATTGSALVLLGVALLLTPLVGRAILPLAWVGGMTLTLYSLHVLAVAYDIDPDDAEQRYVTHVVAAFVIAAGWRSWWPRGPLEQLVSWPSRATARHVSSRAGPRSR